ncbi:ATP-binding protein [Fulvivirgaceae bacterium BMA10]|uniref:histidine kinase n=1 Tax=Splendidivirga corallicola TaxID=3051826 RepID=A0ABT8KIU5_9BACT|nr:ATP-binding protein [Fulvivirgaceae bacterium BMA10]
MKQYNKILLRQINKKLNKDFNIPKEMEGLLDEISDTYDNYEMDRALLERSLDLSSNELLETNEELKKKYKKQENVLDKIKQSISSIKKENNDKGTIEDSDLLSIVDVMQEQVRQTKEAELKLKQNHSKLEALIENTEDIIWSVDDYFRLSIFNSFFKERISNEFGKSPEIGMRIEDFMPPNRWDRWNGFFERSMRGERFSIEEDFQKGDEKYYFETFFNPIRIDDAITGVSIFSRNITFRKESEQKKYALLQDLTKANEELGQIAHIAAHDLKSPLRSIGSIASWIKTDHFHFIDKTGREQLEILIQRVNRLYNLIDSISQYMNLRNSIESREIVNLNSLLADLIKKLKVPNNIKVEIKNPLPKIVAVRNHISILFHHLIKNAITYMDKPEGFIHIGNKRTEGAWEFYVEDNGPGIESKYFTKIFKIFQTLKSRDEHDVNGIGLAISKKIVELNGGQIQVKSELGKGTTFYFTIPFQTITETKQLTI